MDLPTAIATGASAAAIGAAVIGGWKGSAALYRRTLGSRRDLTKRLNKLACGVTVEHVESLFGSHTFQREVDSGYTERIYRTPHAWLLLWFGKGDAVQLISITATDRRFHFNTAWLTFDQLKVALGRSSFREIGDASGTRLEIGARRYEYAESYYFGNPGNYAYYILSYSMAGCGRFAADTAHEAGAPFWRAGDIPSRVDDRSIQPEAAPDLGPFRAGTTINTLTVGTAGMTPAVMARDWVGVDHDFVRGLRLH